MYTRKTLLALLILLVLAGCGDTEGIPSGDLFTQTDWFFQDNLVREVRITIHPDYLNQITLPIYEYPADEKVYALASSISIDGETMTNIGIRSRGNTSSSNHKRQFKISFDCTKPYTNAAPDAYVPFPEYDSRRFRGLKKINLRASQNDPTIIREKIASHVMRQAGVPAPRVGFARVYVNDTYWGLYLLVEQVDKTFLNAHLGEKGGNLYKGEWVGGVGPIFTPGHEDGFVLQTNKDLGDKSGLTGWFNGLAAATTPTQLAAWVDINNVLNYYAAAALIGHWDSFTYGQNNDHLYHHSDGKFRIIPWDMDNTFGSEWTSSSVLESSVYRMRNNDNYQALFQKLLDDPTTRAQYRSTLQTLLNSTFNTTHLFGKIDQWKSLIQSAVLSDTRKNIDWGVDAATGNSWWQDGFTRVPDGWYGNGFNNDGLGLKPWIEGRIARVTAELGSTPLTDQDGNTSFATAAVLAVGTAAGGGISSDVDSDFFAITITSNETYAFTLYDMTGDFDLTLYNAGQTQIGASANSGTADEEISQPLTPGTYYLKVTPKSGASGSYTISSGSRNTIEVSVAFGSGFQLITALGIEYWTAPTGTPLGYSATASDPNSTITNVVFRTASGDPWSSDSSAPFAGSVNLPWTQWFQSFSLKATAWNNEGQTRTSTTIGARVYVSDYQDAVNNGDGTYTFRVNPLHLGGTNGQRVYLAGEMNGWGNSDYTTQSGWELLDEGGGVLALTIASNASCRSGRLYKFNIDRNNDGARDNTTDWVPSPANPYMQLTGDQNSVIP